MGYRCSARSRTSGRCKRNRTWPWKPIRWQRWRSYVQPKRVCVKPLFPCERI